MQKCFQLLLSKYILRRAPTRECSVHLHIFRVPSYEAWEQRRQFKKNEKQKKKKKMLGRGRGKKAAEEKNKKCHRRCALHHLCYSLLKMKWKRPIMRSNLPCAGFFGIDLFIIIYTVARRSFAACSICNVVWCRCTHVLHFSVPPYIVMMRDFFYFTLCIRN